MDDVLESPDLLPAVFSSLSVREGNLAAASQTWACTWQVVLESRTPKHVHTYGPWLPWANAGREPIVLAYPRSVACLPNRELVVALSNAGLVHCTADMKVKQIIMRHGDIKLRNGGLHCDESTLFAPSGSRIVSFKASDLSPLTASEVGPYGVMTISADKVFASLTSSQGEIAVLDKANLRESWRFGLGVVNENIRAMCVLGNELFVSDRGNMPRAQVHIFSLHGAHRRTVKLDDVWHIHRLAVAKGRIFATEFAYAADIADKAERDRARADMGKRVLVLSPELEVLCDFRGEGVSGDLDFWSPVPRGDNELIVTNFERGKVHVFSI